MCNIKLIVHVMISQSKEPFRTGVNWTRISKSLLLSHVARQAGSQVGIQAGSQLDRQADRQSARQAV